MKCAVYSQNEEDLNFITSVNELDLEDHDVLYNENVTEGIEVGVDGDDEQDPDFIDSDRELDVDDDDDATIFEYSVTDDDDPDFVASKNELDFQYNILYDCNVTNGIEVGLNTDDLEHDNELGNAHPVEEGFEVDDELGVSVF